MFEMWDWVGGRYSCDSAIGLSLMIAIGPARFEETLRRFRSMDQHFREAPLQLNLPALQTDRHLVHQLLGRRDPSHPAVQLSTCSCMPTFSGSTWRATASPWTWRAERVTRTLKGECSAPEASNQGLRHEAPQACVRTLECEVRGDLLDSKPDGGIDVHGRSESLEVEAARNGDR